MKKKMRRRETVAPPPEPKRQLKRKAAEPDPPPKRKLMKKAVVRKRIEKMPEPYKGKLPLAKKSKADGCVNIAVGKEPKHEQFKKLDVSGLREGEKAFYTFNKKTGRVEQITTVAASGLHLGWTTCGRCRTNYNYCRCPKGVVHPSSVEWCLLYDKAGQELGTAPPAHSINVMDYLRPNRTENSFDKVRSFDRYANTVTAAQRRALRPPEPEPTTKGGKRKMRRKTVDVTDAKAVTAAAEKSTAQLTKQLRKSLQPKDKPKRSLKRKG